MVKTIRKIGTLGLFLSLFFSCTDKSNELLSTNTGAAGNERVSNLIHLRWMGNWYGEGKKELMIREIARDFSFLNQDIDLQLEFPNQIFNSTSDRLYEVHSDSIAKMVKYNQWPFDILFCDQSRYAKVGELLNNPKWGKDNLVDFANEPWFRAAHKDDFFKDSTFLNLFGGIAPGPFLEGFANILYTSTDVEKALGIEVKKADMTTSDFISYAKAVYDYNQSHQDKIYFYSNQYWAATTLLFNQLAMSVYEKKEQATRDEAVDVLKKTYEILEKLSPYQPLEQYDQATAGSRTLYEKKYLFTISPSWMFILWQMSNPTGVTSMQPAELPSLDNHKPAIYSGSYNAVFVVPKNGKNVEAAKRFVKFMCTSEVAMKWSKYSKSPTALRNNFSYTDFGQDPYNKYYQHIQEKYGNNQLEIDLTKLLLNNSKKLDYKIDAVLKGSLSADDALKQLLKQL